MSTALERRISLLGVEEHKRITFRQPGLAETGSGQRQSDEPRVEGRIRTAGLQKHTEEFGLDVTRNQDPKKLQIAYPGG